MQSINITKSDFFATLDKLSGYALVNLLWIIVSLPIITIPAATAGLFAATIDGVRGKENETFYRFFAGMRQHWRKSTLIFLADLGIGALIAINVLIITRMDMPAAPAAIAFGMTMCVAAVVFAANLYIWTLLVVFDLPLTELFTISLKLVFVHPAWSLLMVGLISVTLLIGSTAPAGIFLFASFVAYAWLVNWGAWRIIRRYEDELTLET